MPKILSLVCLCAEISTMMWPGNNMLMTVLGDAVCALTVPLFVGCRILLSGGKSIEVHFGAHPPALWPKPW